MQLNLMGRSISHSFYVSPNMLDRMIIGVDFIHRHQLSYIAGTNSVHFATQEAWDRAVVTSIKDVTIPARTRRSVKVFAQVEPGLRAPGPTAAVISITATSIPVSGPEVICEVAKDGTSSIMVDNLLDTEFTIKAKTFIGSLERIEIKQCREVAPNEKEIPRSEPPPRTQCNTGKETFLRNNITQQCGKLSKEHSADYIKLIVANHDIFSRNATELGRADIMHHAVKMKDPEPVYVKQFRIPESHRSVLIGHLNNWLKLGVVSPSRSKFNSPIFCIPKGDGTLRPVLDFRAVNKNSYSKKYSQREIKD